MHSRVVVLVLSEAVLVFESWLENDDESNIMPNALGMWILIILSPCTLKHEYSTVPDHVRPGAPEAVARGWSTLGTTPYPEHCQVKRTRCQRRLRARVRQPRATGGAQVL